MLRAYRGFALHSSIALALVATTAVSAGVGADPAVPSPEQAQDRLRGRLDGRHFTARVRFEIRDDSFTENRELDVWRDDAGNRGERLMARFDAPADMRGMGLLYIESLDGPNDYFLYQPAVRRVRRIPETLVSQDVYGVDLEYLGFGIAQLLPVTPEALVVDSLDDRRVFRLTERALGDNPRFDRRVIWLDPETFVPLRTEHHRDGVTTLVARTLALEDRGGVPTPIETIYERPIEGTVVTMKVERVDYEAPIPEVFFSTLQLTKVR